MNKILLTLAIAISFAFSSNAQSESYVPFRVHISPFTYVIPNYTKGYGAGAGISIEPAYAINDNFVAGLKLEAAYSELEQKHLLLSVQLALIS
jgi:hypothetical protein